MTGTNTTMQSCTILAIFGALVISTHCMPPNIGKGSFSYDPNSIEQNEKILKLFLRLAVHTANRLIRLRNEVKVSQDNVVQDAQIDKIESPPAVRFYESNTENTTVIDFPDEQKIVINENPKDPVEDDKNVENVPEAVIEHTPNDGKNVEGPEVDNRSLFSFSKNHYVTHYNDWSTNINNAQTNLNQENVAKENAKTSGTAVFAMSIGGPVILGQNRKSKLKSSILSGGFEVADSRNDESISEKNIAASQSNFDAAQGNAVLVQQNARSKSLMNVDSSLKVNEANTAVSNINKKSSLDVNIARGESEAQEHSENVISGVEEGAAGTFNNVEKQEELGETISESKLNEITTQFINALKPAEKNKVRAEWVKLTTDTSGSLGKEIQEKKNPNLAINLQGTQSRTRQSSASAKHQGNIQLEILHNNAHSNVASSSVQNAQPASAPVIILQDSGSQSKLSNIQQDQSWNTKNAATIVNSHGSIGVIPVVVGQNSKEN